ncbi:MAG: ABC transporter permease [bacterium]|nr:ABC transporter permease [bacterium]
MERTAAAFSLPRIRFIRKRVTFLLSTFSVLLLVFAWWLVVRLHLVSPLFVPAPGAVWNAFISTAGEPYRGHTLLVHVGISLYRVIVAFIAALVVSIPLGLAIGRYWWLDALMQPLINFYRPLPPLAYYTLLVIWLGIGDASKVALLFLAAIPALVINTAAGVHAVRREMVNAALSLGADKWQVFLHVIFPATLPYVFTGIRIALAFTYTTLVAAELVAATSGIGWMVLDASRFLRSDIIFMGIIIMGVTGMVLDYIVVLLQHRFVPWLGKA